MKSETGRMLQRLLIAVAFSMAFGYIEAAVVVYLRALFHPNGFTFPMEVFDATPEARRLMLTEVGREAATLVLILTGAWLFGKVRQERIAYFLIIFAVWDIFYYVWLKVLLDWPATLMDWDILFLIPMAWAVAGPVPGPRVAGDVRLRRGDSAPLRAGTAPDGHAHGLARLVGVAARHCGFVLSRRDSHYRAELRPVLPLAAVRRRIRSGDRLLRQVAAQARARDRNVGIGRIGPIDLLPLSLAACWGWWAAGRPSDGSSPPPPAPQTTRTCRRSSCRPKSAESWSRSG